MLTFRYQMKTILQELPQDTLSQEDNSVLGSRVQFLRIDLHLGDNTFPPYTLEDEALHMAEWGSIPL